jgi:hypothetical protein
MEIDGLKLRDWGAVEEIIDFPQNRLFIDEFLISEGSFVNEGGNDVWTEIPQDCLFQFFIKLLFLVIFRFRIFKKRLT